MYGSLRRLLSKYPKAAMLLTFNLRKKDKRAQYVSTLLTDPRGWLEEVSGTLDILNRSDVRLGMDMQSEDIRVINGIRRGEDMDPVLIRPVGESSEKLAGFERVQPEGLDFTAALTAGQSKYWEQLPTEFRFEDIADKIVPRASLSRLIKRVVSLGKMEKVGEVHRKL